MTRFEIKIEGKGTREELVEALTKQIKAILNLNECYDKVVDLTNSDVSNIFLGDERGICTTTIKSVK